jgi:membrane-associated phospholipid phosphatase
MVRANDPLTRAARLASGSGTALFTGAGLALPLLEDDRAGRDFSLRTADTILTSSLITEALKRITHERRPDGSSYTSFPSGHATLAFAVAGMESHFHPRQAAGWYLGAALIGASRVKLHRHYWHDVLAGALVGYGTSRLELSRPRGLLISPFVHDRLKRDTGGHHGGNGFIFSRSF